MNESMHKKKTVKLTGSDILSLMNRYKTYFLLYQPRNWRVLITIDYTFFM